MARRRFFPAMAIFLLVATTVQVVTVSPAAATPPAPTESRELSRAVFPVDGRKIATPNKYSPKENTRRAATATPPEGTVRQWLGLDDFKGGIYRKDYTLRGVGSTIEVWVANDVAFPAGDCRLADPSATQLTDAQVTALIGEFDGNIRPKEDTIFSTPPARDGTNALLEPDVNGNGGDYTGDGAKTVLLVDNIRDLNFYDLQALPAGGVTGFFSRQYTELLDRNVISVDIFDWAHRSGANPPHEPTADPCTSRPARPRLYEANIAHEWQHALTYYTDPFEAIWLEEGISLFTEAYTGYVNPKATVFDPKPDFRINCYQGFGSVQTPYHNARDCGGPENSLNLWGEGKPPSDIGHAFSFLMYLYDHYGVDLISRMHRDGSAQGLAAVDSALDAEGGPELYRVLHDFQTSTLVDKIVGESRHGFMLGVPKERVTGPSLRSTVNFGNADTNDNPGAAPNGADYTLPKKADGTVLSGHELRSLQFDGAAGLPPIPLRWTVVADDPDRPGDPVLWSGNDYNLDSAAVTPVTVPTADPALRLLAKYGAEFGFDHAYVVVSADGGKTYTTVGGDRTVDAPLGPGLNGTTNGFEPHSFDLSAYAGQSVLLGFRYISDGGTNEGGLKVDDVTLGGTPLSDGSTLDIFDSPTEAAPIEVHNWNVRLIGYDERRSVALQAEFDGRDSFSLNRHQLLLFALFPKVVAVVAYDEPTELVQQYAPYTLKVNGVVQAGGA
ncbi:choice-of-anchor J domain-containing protein [Amycolatopsis sp. YIM 10]|uniref:choice-of-anchor J domain-containing protein n=1 Tax=Amycolatopsis sp. YIM 10 TaxID=2653857 RepID=UPI001D13B15C|nr:choice-of-anchor J domain-containing protein [Amycolatopsis sp. YIM 10]